MEQPFSSPDDPAYWEFEDYIPSAVDRQIDDWLTDEEWIAQELHDCIDRKECPKSLDLAYQIVAEVMRDNPDVKKLSELRYSIKEDTGDYLGLKAAKELNGEEKPAFAVFNAGMKKPGSLNN